MSEPVFFSYARRSNREHALSIYHALGGKEGGLVFLDSESIEHGERFPQRTMDALLSARVVVVFADSLYHERWYCTLELRAALSAYHHAASYPEYADLQEATLHPLVLVLPSRDGADLSRFPPPLQQVNWPTVDDAVAAARFIRARLEASPDTVATLLERTAGLSRVRQELINAAQLPPPLAIEAVWALPEAAVPPSLGDGFFGRGNDLWRIHEALTRNGGVPTTVVIEGGAAVGKTRLALEYCYRFGPRHHPGGVFWINAGIAVPPQLYDALRALDPHAPDFTTLSRMPGGVEKALADALMTAPGCGSILFVVDELPEPDAGRALQPLRSICPAAGITHVLATSRMTRATLEPGATAVPLAPLAPGAATALLKRGFDGRVLSDKEWEFIAAWAGHLPLALELLNRVLIVSATTPEVVLESARTRDALGPLDAAAEHLGVDAPPRGVREAFQLSYACLSAEERRGARIFAHLAPEPVPEELIQAFAPEIFSPPVRSALVSRSLVTRLTGLDVRLFGVMHRLLRDFLRTCPGSLETDARPAVAALHAVLARQVTRVPERWRVFRALLPHGEAALPLLTEFPTDDPAYEQVIGVAEACAWMLNNDGLLDRAGRVLDVALAASAALSPDHAGTLQVLQSLAWLEQQRGNFEHARELQEQVLERRIASLGHLDPLTWHIMHDLGWTLHQLGDYPNAIDLQGRVLAARMEALGDSHPSTLSVTSNLALTLRRSGQVARARELQDHVLRTREQALGEDHSLTLTAMHNLAETVHLQGDLEGARALQQRVYDARVRLHGKRHIFTLHAMHALGWTLHEMQRYDEALALQSEALDLRRELLGPEHQETLATANNLALTKMELGQGEEALELQRFVVHVRRRNFGDRAPRTLIALQTLVEILLQTGRIQEARRILHPLLRTRKEVLGMRHNGTTATAWSLYQLLRSTGKDTAAKRLLKRDLCWITQEDPDAVAQQQQQIRPEVVTLCREARARLERSTAGTEDHGS